MTREEIFKIANETARLLEQSNSGMNDVVNVIKLLVITAKELETININLHCEAIKFESRTCNNCKSKHCDIKIALIKSDSINPDYFCCNDWKQK